MMMLSNATMKRIVSVVLDIWRSFWD